MKKSIILVLMLLFLCAASANAWERHLYPVNKKSSVLEIYGWSNELYGDISAQGLNLNLEREANFDTTIKFGARFMYPITNSTNLSLAFNYLYDEATVNKTFTFNGKNYNTGTRNVDLANSMFDFMGSRVLTRDSSGWLDFCYGIKVINSELNVSDKVRSDRWNVTFPFPYLGLAGGTKITDRLLLDGHFKFISLNYGDSDLNSHDFDMSMSYKLNPYTHDTEWMAMLGYRNFHIKGDNEDDSVKLYYRGPTFGIVGRF
ncbi:MAG: hypothetical protein HQM10_04765 [Candidatus Riflebacteria bacterium]|nr:hypothetical protein [Candidatus Riflebacteria bacterium]